MSGNSVTKMEAKRAASGTCVGGGDPDPNGEVVHVGEASSLNPGIRFSKILECDVVMEELLPYLSVEEMKVLSTVSKEALVAVRKSKVFSKRVYFRISKDSIRSRVLDNCFHRWETVKFDFYEAHNLDGLVDYIPDSSTVSQSLDSVKSFVAWLNYPKDVKDFVRCKINEFVREIIDSSKETLEDLKLRIGHSDLVGIESIHFPNLRRLDLCNNSETYDDIVEALLKNVPPLEKLNVEVSRPSNLFAALQGRMSKLRELDIEIGASRDDSTTPPGAFDWNVVADMTRLKDLSITLKDYGCCRTSIQEVEELLLSIPVENLTNISILVAIIAQEASFSQEMGKHISRFTNLTKLVLCDLRNFDDDSLQKIIKGCPKLIKLTLLGLEKVTDFGFSGVKKTQTGDEFHFGLNERGVALTDLKDLTELHIVDYGIISFATVLEVIRFEYLTTLDVLVVVPSWQTVTPKQFLLQILQQNPSLSKIDLVIGSCNGDGTLQRDNSIEDEMKALYPRIQQLKFEYDPDYSDNDVGDSDDDENVSD